MLAYDTAINCQIKGKIFPTLPSTQGYIGAGCWAGKHKFIDLLMFLNTVYAVFKGKNLES